METIPYRNTQLIVKTIPKDTLLFRFVKNPLNDLRGVPTEDGTRCMTPNFNVFFHPNPFIGHHMYTEFKDEIGDVVSIYLLTKDIKVLSLLGSSKYTRLQHKKKGSFIKQCSTVRKGCLPKKGNTYDPCFSDTLIKKYPDIVGMIGIAAGDLKYMRKALKKGIRGKTQRVFYKAKDALGVEGVPELILHPLTKRPSSDLHVKETDVLENNYKLLKSMKYNEDKLHDFMKDHATYNPDTYFFMYH